MDLPVSGLIVLSILFYLISTHRELISILIELNTGSIGKKSINRLLNTKYFPKSRHAALENGLSTINGFIGLHKEE